MLLPIFVGILELPLATSTPLCAMFPEFQSLPRCLPSFYSATNYATSAAIRSVEFQSLPRCLPSLYGANGNVDQRAGRTAERFNLCRDAFPLYTLTPRCRAIDAKHQRFQSLPRCLPSLYSHLLMA